MKRRQAITITTFGLGGATLAACTGASGHMDHGEMPAGRGSTLPMVEWRMATSWPESLDTLYGTATAIAEDVYAMSGGRFNIKPHAAGELVPGLQVLDAVQQGSVECGHTASHYYISKNPAFAFGTSIPFGLTAQQQNAWLYEGGGNEAMDRLFADFGVVAFPAGNTGAQMGGWFNQKVNQVADLQGLNMRLPGLGGQIMATLGVNVQLLTGEETVLSLERGTIDAAEWAGPYDDEKLGLNKAAKYYYYPGWWEPGPTIHALINQKAWSALPVTYQEMFRVAAAKANLRMLAHYDQRNGTALQRIIGSGTPLIPYSKAILQEARESSLQIYEDNATKDAEFRRVYEQWNRFRQDIQRWTNLNLMSPTNQLI